MPRGIGNTAKGAINTVNEIPYKYALRFSKYKEI